MFKRIFWSGVLLVVLSSAEGGSKCPSKDKIYPCNCHEIIQNAQIFTLVTCSKFAFASEFLDVPRLLDRMMIDRLVLQDFNVTGLQALTLPNAWLENIRCRELEIYNVKLSSEMGYQSTLKGQEETLVKVTFRSSIDSERMNLALLTIAKNLKEIDLSWNRIKTIAQQQFSPQLQDLEIIDLSHNSISTIDQQAFRYFQKLNKINLSYNMLTTLPINMFASQLSAMDFSYNMISRVPEDMFSHTRLHSLGQVLFTHNNLQDLPMDTWLSAIRVASIVDVSDNLLACNCSMSWITSQVKRESQVIGTCAIPGEIELQPITNITLKQNCTNML